MQKEKTILVVGEVPSSAYRPVSRALLGKSFKPKVVRSDLDNFLEACGFGADVWSRRFGDVAAIIMGRKTRRLWDAGNISIPAELKSGPIELYAALPSGEAEYLCVV